ncbi:hypothetical protein [Spiroplasma endosymbiont of Labia minor]|uniref:hypothetical protein n=1 Tax=Spiroplasma endosymbiont of Labia minor TaxID=3066305 RepID=UPI0030D58A7E
MSTDIDTFITTFKPVGKYGWSIIDRHYDIKRLLSEGKIFFSSNLTVTKKIGDNEIVVKKYGHLYDALYRCINNQDKLYRDEKSIKNKRILDYINAFEHAISYWKSYLFQW